MNMNIAHLDSGTEDLEYNRGWKLAEDHLRAGQPANGAVPPEVKTPTEAEGYHDRMAIHSFNERSNP